MQLLTKGILKFPAGLGSRWDKIAEYIGGTKNIHEVTAMAKELSVKNVRGEKNIIETIKAKTEAPKPAETKPATEAKPAGDKVPEWSQNQQKALEAAYKQYPASMDKNERWTKIAEAVPGKTPKECIARVKEIKTNLTVKKAE